MENPPIKFSQHVTHNWKYAVYVTDSVTEQINKPPPHASDITQALTRNKLYMYGVEVYYIK